jgi:hypothetical protein
MAAISLMKLTLVASMALLAYLIISAVRRSVIGIAQGPQFDPYCRGQPASRRNGLADADSRQHLLNHGRGRALELFDCKGTGGAGAACRPA